VIVQPAPSLFDSAATGQPVSFDPAFGRARRRMLTDGAWIEHVPRWVRGHDRLLGRLRDGLRWRDERRPMYDRIIDVPRRLATFPDDGEPPAVVLDMARALGERFGRPLPRVSAAFYRDGRDSVAMHGDRVGRLRDDTVVAVVGLGFPRRFKLVPARGGPGLELALGWGDLLVMGGTCQRTWRHGVPKVARAGPRISLQFRESGA
jgi:alkylated DNA repair dioxygenase AlkB